MSGYRGFKRMLIDSTIDLGVPPDNNDLVKALHLSKQLPGCKAKIRNPSRIHLLQRVEGLIISLKDMRAPIQRVVSEYSTLLKSPPSRDELNKLSDNRLERVYQAFAYKTNSAEYITCVLSIVRLAICITDNTSDEDVFEVQDMLDLLMPRPVYVPTLDDYNPLVDIVPTLDIHNPLDVYNSLMDVD
jgi:hypothetical protein